MLITHTYVELLDGSRDLHRIDVPLPENEFPQSSTSWSYQCINLYEYFTLSSNFTNVGLDFTLHRLEFSRSNGDLWIDEPSIQQRRNQSKAEYNIKNLLINT